jgi:hypothetical protein
MHLFQHFCRVFEDNALIYIIHEFGELLFELSPGSFIAFAIVMTSRFFSFPHNSFIDKLVVVASYYRGAYHSRNISAQ